MRLSSTPLGALLQCERKLWEEHSQKATSHPLVTSEPMAFGTVFHALAEFQMVRGRLPSKVEFSKMKGNYDDPIDAAKAFPAVYDQAVETIQYLLDTTPELFDVPDSAEVEKPLDDFGVEIGGMLAQGYIDLFLPDDRKISDWKTRGGLHYVPRTQEDFRADPQLCYYGAVVAYAMGWESITVEHRNVLRPDKGGPTLLVVEVELPAFYLRGVFEHLDKTLVPKLIETLETPDKLDVPRRIENCFAKGPCPHLSYCYPGRNDPPDGLDIMNAGVEFADPFDLLNGGN